MLKTYKRFSRYFFAAVLLVFALIIGRIALQTWQQSKCLARLLPTAENPEIFAGTVAAPLNVTQPALLIRSKDNHVQWLGEKYKQADFLPFTMLVWTKHYKSPLHFEKSKQYQSQDLFTRLDDVIAIRLPIRPLEPADRLQIQLISAALPAGEIANLELYESSSQMIMTRDTLIGFFLVSSILFLIIINGVKYPFAAAAQPQPAILSDSSQQTPETTKKND